MDSPRKPTIILKFKNPTTTREQAECDYSESDDVEELGEGYLQFGAYGGIKKKKKVTSGDGGGGSGMRESSAAGGGVSPPCCQVDSCAADLAVAKRYHQRHKVCEAHAKAPVVVVAGLLQRFCQQCSRFHEVSEFDEARRSCRSRLAGHNQRRRKSSSETTQVDLGQSSRHRSSSLRQPRQGGERNRASVPPPGKQFQIR